MAVQWGAMASEAMEAAMAWEMSGAVGPCRKGS